MANTSFLDLLKAKDIGPTLSDLHSEKVEELVIISSCPTCGLPIYGKPKVTLTEEIFIRYSCHCRNKSFTETMQTK